jgi:hypothetical protein
MNKTNLDSLLLDLVNVIVYENGGRRYKVWEKPKMQENIDWFTSKAQEKNISFKLAAHNDELLEERLQYLINEGLDLKNMAHIIANVNKPLFFKKALDNGANPNLIISSEIMGERESLLENAVSKGMNSIAKIIINHPNFNWDFKSKYYPNILFKCFLYEKFELAQMIAIKKPEFILENGNEPSIAYFVSSFMYNHENNKDKLLNFIEYCANYAQSKNAPFDINETYKGKMLFEISMDVASIIKKVEAEYLSNELKNELDTNTKRIKI